MPYKISKHNLMGQLINIIGFDSIMLKFIINKSLVMVWNFRVLGKYFKTLYIYRL